MPDLLDSVRALIPLIAARESDAEVARAPDDEVIQQLKDTGVFRAFVPERFGGLEIDYQTFMRIGISIAEACTSTAWVTTFYMEHNWLLAHFDIQTQAAVWGKQPFFLAPATISPNGEAQPVDGGHRVSGRWQWGTGIMHADWVMVAARVANADDRPQMRMFMVPRDQVQVEDTWHVDGMAATGSNDMILDDVFVAEYFSQDLGLMMLGHSPGALALDSPTFKTPMIPFKCITAACPSVGAAKRAVALFQQRLAERTVFGSTNTQSQHTAAQIRLGKLTARAQLLERAMLAVAHDLEQWGHQAEPCPPEERSRIRLTCALLVHEARDIVRDVMEASGASAHFLAHPVQRIHRDVHTMACHTVFDADLGGELYGQTLLNLPLSRPV